MASIRKEFRKNTQFSANIFVDNSIVEIFFNKGEKVFTSRVFPSTEQTGIKVTSGNVSGHYFNLKY